MKIPFCLPLIDKDVVDEVNDCLLNTGWLTSGPKVQQLEKEFAKLTNAPAALCVNSWTSGAMLILKWFGVKPGDEIIIPAYTYSATALCAMTIGAIPVMVDIGDDFNIATEKIKAAITPKTKAILPVDFGGNPCNYDDILALVNQEEVKDLFVAETERQEKLGRLLVLSDSAHSVGATYNGREAGVFTDVTIFSLHSVKNITAGEGGAICLNLPAPFDIKEELQFLKYFSLNGQTKSAFEKNKVGAWRYDIIDQGLKVNMPDICAAIALAQIRKYRTDMLPERKAIYEQYNDVFKKLDWVQLPPQDSPSKTSSYHLYALRIKNITETQRDEIIQYVSERGVGVNVHYIPMAMLTLFKNRGYKIEDYPNTYDSYSREISLPIYNNLGKDKVDYVIKSIIDGYHHVVGA